MTPQDIQAKLSASPFKPFTILTTRTGKYPIESPGHVLVTRTKLLVAKSIGSDGVIEELQEIPLAQITRLS